MIWDRDERAVTCGFLVGFHVVETFWLRSSGVVYCLVFLKDMKKIFEHLSLWREKKLSCTSRLTSLVQVSYKFSVRLGGPPEASSARLFNMNSGVFHSPSRFFKFTLPLKAALPVWPLSCVDPLAVRGTPSWIPLKNWLFRLVRPVFDCPVDSEG